MSLESAIADLVSASTSLVSAVNVTKTTIEETGAAAAAQVQPAAASATEAQTQASAAATSAGTVSSKLATAAADYAAQRVTKGIAAVQTEAESAWQDHLARNDPARHAFRGNRPSLVMDFVRRECHRQNGGVLEPVDLNSFMTFTRASTATYTGPDGLLKTAGVNEPRYDYDPVTGECKGLLVEEARTNLLTYSNRFDNVIWNKPSSYVKQNQAIAPDGTLTASKICDNTTADIHGVRYNPFTLTSGVTYTFSVYVKAAEISYVLIDNYNGSSDVVGIVNLTNGVVTQGSSISVTPVGNGWYRVAQTFTATSTVSTPYAAQIYTHVTGTGSASHIGTDGAGIYVFGAQLEVGAFPTSYIPTPATFTGRASTATYLNANGVLQTAASGVARSAAYDYDADGVLRPVGLLLENSATNLLIQSQDFSGWDTNYCITPPTISRNTAISPSGIASCADITFTTDSSQHDGLYIFGPSIPANTVYTASVFLKKSVGSTLRIRIEGNACFGGTSDIYFDQTTGNILQQQNIGVPFSVNVVNYGAWYRICVTRTTIAAGNVNVCFYSGVAGTNRFVIYGAQLETGPVATSYIPTTTAQVTRAADTSTSAQVTRGSDVATSTQAGALYTLGGGTTCVDVHQSKRGSWPGFYHWVGDYSVFADVGMNYLCGRGSAGSVGIANGNHGVRCRHALSQTRTTVTASQDGGGAISSNLSRYPTPVTALNIGIGITDYLNSTVRCIAYYPRTFSNADLQALTILED